MVDPPEAPADCEAFADTDGVRAGPVGTVAAFLGSSSHDAMKRTARRRGIARFIEAPTTFRVADWPSRRRPFFGSLAVSRQTRPMALRTGFTTGVPCRKERTDVIATGSRSIGRYDRTVKLMTKSFMLSRMAPRVAEESRTLGRSNWHAA